MLIDFFLRSLFICYDTSMNIRNMLKWPVRHTVIVIFVSVVLFLMFTWIVRGLDQTIDAQNIGRCAGLTDCRLHVSATTKAIHYLAYDFQTLVRYAGELGIALLIAQALYKVRNRH